MGLAVVFTGRRASIDELRRVGTLPYGCTPASTVILFFKLINVLLFLAVDIDSIRYIIWYFYRSISLLWVIVKSAMLHLPPVEAR